MGVTRRSRTPVDLPNTVRHGTPAAYVYYGCGCEPCLTSHREYQATHRQRRYATRVRVAERWINVDVRTPHGRLGGYTDWGCQCDRCLDAIQAYRERRTTED